jgi:hypothetical protein
LFVRVVRLQLYVCNPAAGHLHRALIMTICRPFAPIHTGTMGRPYYRAALPNPTRSMIDEHRPRPLYQQNKTIKVLSFSMCLKFVVQKFTA